jgi:hypothetical protein
MTLVRPDQHVAWRGERLHAPPGDLLARVSGHVKAPAVRGAIA